MVTPMYHISGTSDSGSLVNFSSSVAKLKSQSMLLLTGPPREIRGPGA